MIKKENYIEKMAKRIDLRMLAVHSNSSEGYGGNPQKEAEAIVLKIISDTKKACKREADKHRYYLFGYDNYAASGGIDDLIGVFDSVVDAAEYRQSLDWQRDVFYIYTINAADGGFDIVETEAMGL
ncbi:hypothetical protein LCGC14_1937660 [marine sediment metagenome]|uniref:Uncharacterized protein n=1 Tax=marine sediment metagenome TaxID=412755 RepID=A0A0F9FL56_9ZZZZ